MTGTRLKGKVAIVTGGASGFGKAISTRFSQEGCKVLIGDLNESGARELATALSASSPDILSQSMDVTNEAHWRSAIDTCVRKWGCVDIVVNNAGTTYKNKPTLEVTEQEFNLVFNVNVKSIYLSVGATVPQMKRNGGGSIINISSTGSLRPRPGLVWYNASKAAVTNATKGLAAEYGADNIRVNAIAPLLSGTGLFSSFVGVEDTPENRASFVSNVPLGRLTDPMDVAHTALFLASEEGSFINGVNLEVDGGKCV
ncbi:hypothetical protein E2P81_ATG11070 [Venturia nashicola]|uniref:Oxidoreductase n=1 Tax=Venturia nashicola TaxID=86259 RepID=A0A4Z1P7U7_9PEZI|nr:hypothetical protein E6O75_ATG10748 [Venturia nashicola]TLD27782.1 hypothetical protein E2P81_ATG11070 [Venturia nashicola]